MLGKTRWQVVGILVFLSVVWVSLATANRTKDVTKSFKVKKGGQLVVDVEDAAADITIKVWGKGEVLVKASGIPEDDLDDMEISASGNTVSIEYYGDGRWRRYRHVTIQVHVPSEFDLDLSTSGGDIEVDDTIRGTVEAATSGGDIDVRDVDGELTLHTSGGDVTAGNVTGDAELKTSGGDIEIGDASGRVKVMTSGGDIYVGTVTKDLEAKTAGGDITVGDVGGYASVSTAGGDIQLGKVSGTAQLRTAGGDIELLSATGKVKAQTAGGDIQCEDITGSIDAETAGGDIVCELKPGGNRGSNFNTAGGDIELYIPADAKVTIEARIRLRGHWYDDDDDYDAYDIYSDFKPTKKDKSRKTITAQFVLNGGGKPIHVETTNGDIEIRKLR